MLIILPVYGSAKEFHPQTSTMLISEWDSVPQNGQRTNARNFRTLFLVMIAITLVLICCYCLYSDVSGLSPSTSSFLTERLESIHKNFMSTLKRALSSSSSEHPAIILLWTSYFSQTGIWLPSPSSLECPVSNCLVTDDRSLLNTSAAVVFHWRSVNVSDLPPERYPNQRWVLFNKEAPPHTPTRILEVLSPKINWTVTYRKDSDIYAPYGWIARRKMPVAISKPPAGRRLVCWLVSNCNTPSGRENYVEILRGFIPVDVFGKCGDLKCLTGDTLGCYRALSRRCKFYLSFENAICKDYSTEKLFNALSTDMVPVVMGGEDYRKILPPNSYIDALSFDGPQQLAEYLQSLDKDDDKYLSYLAWKKDFEVVDGSWRWTCELCRKLHVKDNKMYGDLRHWWYETSFCSSWYELLNAFSSMDSGEVF